MIPSIRKFQNVKIPPTLSLLSVITSQYSISLQAPFTSKLTRNQYLLPHSYHHPFNVNIPSDAVPTPIIPAPEFPSKLQTRNLLLLLPRASTQLPTISRASRSCRLFRIRRCVFSTDIRFRSSPLSIFST